MDAVTCMERRQWEWKGVQKVKWQDWRLLHCGAGEKSRMAPRFAPGNEGMRVPFVKWKPGWGADRGLSPPQSLVFIVCIVFTNKGSTSY